MDDCLRVGDDVDEAIRQMFNAGHVWIRKNPVSGDVEIQLTEEGMAAARTVVQELGIVDEDDAS